jgi:DnaK suppressor protein
MSIDTQRFRTELLEERERVQAAIANLRESHPGSLDDEVEEISTGSDNHIGDSATATLGREIDYTLGENSEQVLAEINTALQRIDEGTYGTCAVCGKEIAHERLEAYPWASLCIDDARKAERG